MIQAIELYSSPADGNYYLRLCQEKGFIVDPRICALTLEDELPTVDCLTESFLGSEDNEPEASSRWVLGQKYKDDFESDELRSWYKWFKRWDFLESIHYGAVFGVRDLEDKAKILGCLCVFPPGSYEKLGLLSYNATLERMASIAPHYQRPQLYEQLTGARYAQFLQLMVVKHKEIMGSKKHWYVFLLGVRPEAQGKKIGKALLTFVASLADHDDLPVYIETVGDRNRSIYEYFGYTDIVKCKLEVKESLNLTAESGTFQDFLENIFCMTRPPNVRKDEKKQEKGCNQCCSVM